MPTLKDMTKKQKEVFNMMKDCKNVSLSIPNAGKQTLKDIREDIDTRNKILKILQSCPVEESSCEICMKVLETYYSLAYQAGIDMALKEIEEEMPPYNEDAESEYSGAYEYHSVRKALSSLKEKIISDNQK